MHACSNTCTVVIISLYVLNYYSLYLKGIIYYSITNFKKEKISMSMAPIIIYIKN